MNYTVPKVAFDKAALILRETLGSRWKGRVEIQFGDDGGHVSSLTPFARTTPDEVAALTNERKRA